MRVEFRFGNPRDWILGRRGRIRRRKNIFGILFEERVMKTDMFLHKVLTGIIYDIYFFFFFFFLTIIAH